MCLYQYKICVGCFRPQDQQHLNRTPALNILNPKL